MFERFTESARRATFMARYEAAVAGSARIETQHLLLGLMREAPELARQAAGSKEAVASLRKELEALPAGSKAGPAVDLPLSRESKRALAWGAREARGMKHARVTAAHLLLGLLRMEDSAAAQALRRRGVNLEEARKLVPDQPAAEAEPPPSTTREELHRLVDRLPERSLGDAAGVLRIYLPYDRPARPLRTRAPRDPVSMLTGKARRCIFFGRYEASQFGSPTIETEHLLLGILREDKELARRLQLPAERIRQQIEAERETRDRISTSADLPLSQESQQAMTYAEQEAAELQQDDIGAGHLVLGLLRVEGCFAARILKGHGVDSGKVREALRGD